jgi:hypothetical protein
MIMMIRHHRPSDNDDGFATDDDQMMIICYTDIRHQDALLSAHKEKVSQNRTKTRLCTLPVSRQLAVPTERNTKRKSRQTHR